MYVYIHTHIHVCVYVASIPTTSACLGPGAILSIRGDYR